MPEEPGLIRCRRTARATRSAPSVNSQCPVVASTPSACITATMSPPLDCKRGVGALQRIAAVEQQHALGAALGADGLDERRHAIHAADAAVGLGQRLEVGRGQHVGLERARPRCRSAARRSLPDKVRQLASRLADAEVERGLAEVERLELRMAVGHVQEGELALRREAQQVLLADRAAAPRRGPAGRPAR